MWPKSSCANVWAYNGSFRMFKAKYLATNYLMIQSSKIEYVFILDHTFQS